MRWAAFPVTALVSVVRRGVVWRGEWDGAAEPPGVGGGEGGGDAHHAGVEGDSLSL
eukprot:COSAG02_NODE_12504_length_1535_cov_29.778552_1_plen_55_part_01